MSSITETLASLTKTLDTIDPGAPVTKAMTKEQFIAYAKGEVDKAAKETEEKAKKRLTALKASVAFVQKASWEGTNEQLIPIYQEPNLTDKADESSTDIATPPAPSGTAADGASVFAKQLEELVATLDKATAPVKKEETFWPNDINTPEFVKEGITKRGDIWGTDPE